MVSVVAFIRPHRLEAVRSALTSLGASGMSVSDSRGRGNASEAPRWSASGAQISSFPVRTRIEVVVEDEMKETVIESICEHAATGEPGDGKIFVTRVLEARRIRTGESGEAAL